MNISKLAVHCMISLTTVIIWGGSQQDWSWSDQ